MGVLSSCCEARATRQVEAAMVEFEKLFKFFLKAEEKELPDLEEALDDLLDELEKDHGSTFKREQFKAYIYDDSGHPYQHSQEVIVRPCEAVRPMLLISSDVASLDGLLSWWENAEYIAEAFVILGCLGEFTAEFTNIRTPGWRHQLSKVSLLVLIAALAFELGALVRTNRLSGQEIALLNGVAADARTRAANAEGTAKGFDSKIAEAQRGTAEAQRDAETAKERASKADERATVNEKEAARLGKLAADESLARVNIEKQLAPRTLSESDREMIGKQLRPFAPSFSARKVKISSYSADAEGIVFSLEIMDILTRAGIDVEPIIGRVMPVGLVTVGVKVTGPIADGMFIKSLITGIRADVDTTLNGEWNSKYTEVNIEVGVKPVAGLPAVIQPPVTPPQK
jgi:hypothetical protein